MVGNPSVTRVAHEAASTATGIAAPAAARPDTTTGDPPRADLAARRPASAASHRDPIVSTIGTARNRMVCGPKPEVSCIVAITSARKERRAVNSPILAHVHRPNPPNTRCCARAST